MATSSISGSAGTLSSLGVGSGLDAESIVKQLVAVERQPISRLQEQATKMQTKISAYSQVKSLVSGFQDAVSKMLDPGFWSSMKATSSDTTALTVSTGTGAASGNYSVSVSRLAASQSVVTNAAVPSATEALGGTGRLSIQLGSWSATAEGSSTFTAGSSDAVNIDIAAGDSLEKIRDKINQAKAGVTATIVKDANGARLVTSSTQTGEANGFRITASATPATSEDGTPAEPTPTSGIVQALAYDPAQATTGTRLTQAAANAQATINGVDVSSASNTFSEVLTGLSLTVSKVTTAPVTLNVTQDNDTITKGFNDFATAYNSLASYLKNNTKYDETSKTGGTLQGDSMALSVLNQLRACLGSSNTASSAFGTLSSVGLQMSTSGTITVNTSKLNSALGNLEELKKFFTNTGTEGGTNVGLGNSLTSITRAMLDTEGPISTRTEGLRTTIKNNEKQQARLDDRAALYEKRLRAQYTALDKAMASITQQSGYVSQAIKALSNSSS